MRHGVQNGPFTPEPMLHISKIFFGHFSRSNKKDHIYHLLMGMCVFFLSLWGSEVVLRRFDCSALLFIPNESKKKKTFIPYIYNASNKEPFLDSQRNVIKSTFPQ